MWRLFMSFGLAAVAVVMSAVWVGSRGGRLPAGADEARQELRAAIRRVELPVPTPAGAPGPEPAEPAAEPAPVTAATPVAEAAVTEAVPEVEVAAPAPLRDAEPGTDAKPKPPPGPVVPAAADALEPIDAPALDQDEWAHLIRRMLAAYPSTAQTGEQR